MVVFGGILFIFSESSAVMVPIECRNKAIFRAAYCTSKDNTFNLIEGRVSVPLESGVFTSSFIWMSPILIWVVVYINVPFYFMRL